MAELIVVLVVIGVLAVTAGPKVTAMLGVVDDAWRDQVVAALRQAQKTAVASRRLVCATVATGSVTLAIAPANPATTCSANIAGSDTTSTVAHSSSTAATTVSPAGTLYFQPSGRITSDGAGTSATTFTIGIANESAITVVGATGHVR
jgi:type II secretory pathway pseudopilin PulG